MSLRGSLLITGGTGTFGNAVAGRVLGAESGERGLDEIRIFSRDEKKQDDMRRRYADRRLRFYLGDVRDEQGLRDAMGGVDYVFHAAALKQVPSCEFFPVEAMRTNALGTENVLNAAIAARVKRVIVLSTDKAVYPINAMGISKAMMEKIAVAKSRVAGQETVICCTRYGNVMGSRGSVVPLLVRHVQAGQDLPVTDPAMTRFMMSIDGAVDLVLWAFEHGNPGDIFVQKSPAASIATLAQAVNRVFATDRPIRVIGTRHGEKLYETLLTREEKAVAQDMGGYYRVAADNRDLNYALYFDSGRREVSAHDDYTSHNTTQLTVAEVSDLLLSLDTVKRALAGERIEE